MADAETEQPDSVRERVLRAVADRDITENRRGLRWWTSETEYRLLTAAEKKHLRALVAEGVIRFETAGGYPNGWRIGGYAIAPGHRYSPVERGGGDT